MLMTDAQVAARLKSLRGWRREGDFITRTFDFDTFMQAMEFLNKVAVLAERRDHHPDIEVRYTRVNLSVQTHSEGGLTRRDFALAGDIQRVAPKDSL